MRLIVDRQRCQGHALCASLCPRLFQLDDLGYSIPIDEEVPRDLERTARLAVENCPEGAISVTEAATGVRTPRNHE
ncbi:MAG: ferredoxin [Candidatus Binatia bacterium]